MPPPSPVPPLPADCRVETIHFWMEGIDNGACAYHDLARAVRALVESVATRAVIAYDPMANGDPKLDDVLARVLGGAP